MSLVWFSYKADFAISLLLGMSAWILKPMYELQIVICLNTTCPYESVRILRMTSSLCYKGQGFNKFCTDRSNLFTQIIHTDQVSTAGAEVCLSPQRNQSNFTADKLIHTSSSNGSQGENLHTWSDPNSRAEPKGGVLKSHNCSFFW